MTSGDLSFTETVKDGDTAVIFYLPKEGKWTVTGANSKYSFTVTDNVIVSDEDTSIELEFISRTLNENSWAVIQKVAKAGKAANYWKVGDTKEIILNGSF